jgi:glutamyl-tRNA synthetase
VGDIVRQAEPYFREEIAYDPDAVSKQWKDPDATASLLGEARERLSALPRWVPDDLEPALRELAEARGISAGKLFQPLRVALTGLTVSPGIFDVLVVLGRERSLARLDAAVRLLRTEGMNDGS